MQPDIDCLDVYRSNSIFFVKADSEDQARWYALELVNNWNEADYGKCVNFLSAAKEPM